MVERVCGGLRVVQCDSDDQGESHAGTPRGGKTRLKLCEAWLRKLD